MSEPERKLGVEDIFSRAEELVKKSKQVMKVLYQLAFIATSESPDAAKAEELINKMIEMGLITERQKWKAYDDVVRWRKRVLDRLLTDYDYYPPRVKENEADVPSY